MKTIIILGNIGSGKTSLAQLINQEFNLPHFCIDQFRIQYCPYGWTTEGENKAWADFENQVMTQNSIFETCGTMFFSDVLHCLNPLIIHLDLNNSLSLECEVGCILQVEKQTMSGKKYNQLLFKEERGTQEDSKFINQDCPKCGHLFFILYRDQVTEAFIAEFIPTAHYSKRQLKSVKVAIPFTPGSPMLLYTEIPAKHLRGIVSEK